MPIANGVVGPGGAPVPRVENGASTLAEQVVPSGMGGGVRTGFWVLADWAMGREGCRECNRKLALPERML
jgi:hypothetical protein